MEFATVEELEAYLRDKYDEVLTTDEMRDKYEVVGFMAPFCVVRRRSDGVRGSLEFTHMPRFYFGFVEDK